MPALCAHTPRGSFSPLGDAYEVAAKKREEAERQARQGEDKRAGRRTSSGFSAFKEQMEQVGRVERAGVAVAWEPV